MADSTVYIAKNLLPRKLVMSVNEHYIMLLVSPSLYRWVLVSPTERLQVAVLTYYPLNIL
jgi:hypothetical protein